MQSDGVFILGIFLLFFLIWAFAGGPSRPISFAGPFITPITNEGQTQTAYGPQLKVGGTIDLPGAALTATERAATTTAVQTTATSAPQTTNTTHKTTTVTPVTTTTTGTSKAGAVADSKFVTITHLAGTTASPTGFVEVSVSPSAGQSVDITNWSITSSAQEESGQIPTGILVMRLGAANTLQEIILKPGDKATIAPGESPAVSSFEANECSGYLTSDESQYNSCVTAHVNDAGFLAGLWYVYLGRTTALWKTSGDTVSLLDGSGNLVASYTY
jgi:hypothetical protein